MLSSHNPRQRHGLDEVHNLLCHASLIVVIVHPVHERRFFVRVVQDSSNKRLHDSRLWILEVLLDGDAVEGVDWLPNSNRGAMKHSPTP